MAQNNRFSAEYAAKLARLNKEISTSDAVDGALFREDLQQGMVISGPMEAPLRRRLNRTPGEGQAHAFWRLNPNTDTSKGVFYGTTPGNGVFIRGGLPTAAIEDYDRVSYPYFNIGDIATIPWQTQAEGRSYTDLLAQRKRVKANNVVFMEEYFLWWGDSSVTQTGGGKVFDGVYKQLNTLGGNKVVSQDGKLNLGLVRKLQKQIVDKGGMPRVNFMDTMGKAIIEAQISQEYQLRQQSGAAGFNGASLGISTDEYNFGFGPTPLLWDRYLVPDPDGTYCWFCLDDKSQDQMNESSLNVIECIDVDPLHMVPLARVATSDQAVIYETMCLMISVPQFSGFVKGLTYNGQDEING